MTDNKGLCRLFEPESIAIIGASSHEGKKGHEILRNLTLSGYSGEVFPVNTKSSSILGLRTYRDLSEIGRPVDLAVIAIPAAAVESTLRQCARKRVKNAIIIATGFSDIGNYELEQRIVSIARDYGIRLLGPDSFGIFNSKNRMNCTFGSNNVLTGKTAFVTQSCAIGLALMTWTTENRYRISSIVSTGTKSDLCDADIIDFLSEDANTDSIVIYVEGLKDARKFFESAKRVTKKKPIILIKSGRSKVGARAATAHTGSVVGSDTIFNAALGQTGILRAQSITDAFDWAQAFNHNPLPKGESIIIVTNCGALGVLASDRSEYVGLNLMNPITSKLNRGLSKVLPPTASLSNPVDLTSDADGELYASALAILNECEDVHGVVVLFVQTDNFDPTLVADSIVRLEKKVQFVKPITIGFMGGYLARLGYAKLLEADLAAYSNLERAVDSMNALVTRSRYLNCLIKARAPQKVGVSPANGMGVTMNLQKTITVESNANSKQTPIIQVQHSRQFTNLSSRDALSHMKNSPRK